jgi:uncharacterized membrane protein
MFKLPSTLPKRISLLLLAAFFMVAGLNHFVNPDFYVAIMPPSLPAHLTLVFISGFFEILGGVGLLFAAWRKWAGYGLILLLFAVFPANIYMAMNPTLFGETETFTVALYLRLPLQFLLMGWIYWAIQPDKSPPP